ncbi:Postreplication repair E3 ubiquitin-protein ligase rad18 [Cladophialophora carrionii]|uniref:Postreplication repair E3 ubiquitin-protein ligase RAD18 n=1 Tax=Cladophialophora carrionii TaxID=86049 RepID=A0A1C1CAA0_9EURO|nr:Postreplication repair E3 ubiquitin-protein ligase rad18 [Cladophialophora carrionii]
MPEHDELTDSTDWLPTPLAALAPLDSSLRCQVCKDFFTTPMMTSCSHTFCSLCIRRYLSQEGRCPACRESDQEIKLRRNWAVEELVANFTASRKSILTFATAAAAEEAQQQQQQQRDGAEEQRPSKRRKVDVAPATTNGLERRSTRSQSRKSQQSAPAPAAAQEVIIGDSEDDDEGSVFEDPEDKYPSPHFAPANGTTQSHEGLVECPCCGRRVKEALINSHLDRCIQGDSSTPIDTGVSSSSPAPSNGRPGQVAPPGTIAYSQRKPALQSERLPFINYSLFSDAKLRQKLKELGIPNHGSKDLMRRRHTEWVNLWNANCDSTTPDSKPHLLRELKVWEDTLGRQLERPTTNTGFMAKDFDRGSHLRAQKSNFDDLIRQARERAKLHAAQRSEEKDTMTPEAISDTRIEPVNLRPPQPHHPSESEATYPHRTADQGTTAELGIENATARPTDEARTDLPDGGAVEPGIDTSTPQPVRDPSAEASAFQNGMSTAPRTPSRRFFV